MAKKEKRESNKPSTAWQTTYGDMITLMLCFFVMVYNPEEADPLESAQLIAAITGDPTGGGQSLAIGRLSDMGNTIDALPSVEMGKSLGTSAKRAISVFTPEVKSNRVTIRNDERGLIISLVADVFFKEGSAEIDIDEARETLMKIAHFVNAAEVSQKRFRIEGHTDKADMENSIWPSAWELSTARAATVLHYLSDYGANERYFSIAGFADTMPIQSDDTPDGRAYNRRVDIVILDDGHF